MQFGLHDPQLGGTDTISSKVYCERWHASIMRCVKGWAAMVAKSTC